MRTRTVALGSDDRLQAQTALTIKISKFVIGLESTSETAAFHHKVVLLAEDNGSAVRLVESDGIVLAEMLLQEFFCYIVGHKNRSEEHTSELQSRFDLVC